VAQRTVDQIFLAIRITIPIQGLYFHSCVVHFYGDVSIYSQLYNSSSEVRRISWRRRRFMLSVFWVLLVFFVSADFVMLWTNTIETLISLLQ